MTRMIFRYLRLRWRLAMYRRASMTLIRRQNRLIEALLAEPSAAGQHGLAENPPILSRSVGESGNGWSQGVEPAAAPGREPAGQGDPHHGG